MNDLELRSKRIEKWAKVATFAVFGFLFFPFAIATIQGMISLLIVGGIGLVTVNVGVPWFAETLANWRLKAYKATAAANPIETYEKIYEKRKNALGQIRENIKEFHTVIQALKENIDRHNSEYPDSPSQFQSKYDKMGQLLEMRKRKYITAQHQLVEFEKLIDQKRSDWAVAQAAAKAMKLANVGEEFTTKLMQDTAFQTIQNGLNMAFSELEVSILDNELNASQPTQQVTIQSTVVAPKQISASSTVSTLDLDFLEEPNRR